MSRMYTQNMFLSRPRNMDMDSQAPSVDLTMAVIPSPGIAHSGSEVAQSSHTGSLRNFDINRLPSAMDDEEEEVEGEAEGGGGTSSAVSSASPFILSGEVDRSQIHDSPMKKTSDDDSNNKSDHEDGEGGGAGQAPPRKKLRLSKEQSALLEESFREHHTLNPKQKSALAKQLNLKSRQVEVWFQNRRARTKLKQTEVDCEFLKRCCESLTEENRRLQREVEELRAIKVAPPCVIAQDFYMPLPAATLTMCPSCERMGSTIDKRALTFAKPSYYVNNIRQPSAAC